MGSQEWSPIGKAPWATIERTESRKWYENVSFGSTATSGGPFCEDGWIGEIVEASFRVVVNICDGLGRARRRSRLFSVLRLRESIDVGWWVGIQGHPGAV